MNYNKKLVQDALSQLATEFENDPEGQNKMISATFIAKRIRDTATNIERSNEYFKKIKPFEDMDKRLDILLRSLGMDSDSIFKEDR